MQANIHTPQRLAGETMQDYRARRKDSRLANERIACKGLGGGETSRQRYRNSMRRSGAMGKRIRAYKALMAAWAVKRIQKPTLRDENGVAYTLVGQPKRMWLGGISAQRGY